MSPGGHGEEGAHCSHTAAPGGSAALTPPLLLRAQEVKEEPFFKGLDWQMVFLQKVRGTAQGWGCGGTGGTPWTPPLPPAVPTAPDPTSG